MPRFNWLCLGYVVAYLITEIFCLFHKVETRRSSVPELPGDVHYARGVAPLCESRACRVDARSEPGRCRRIGLLLPDRASPRCSTLSSIRAAHAPWRVLKGAAAGAILGGSPTSSFRYGWPARTRATRVASHSVPIPYPTWPTWPSFFWVIATPTWLMWVPNQTLGYPLG